MSIWFLSAVVLVSGAIVGLGLFLHVAAIIKQKRSVFGLLLKFFGLAPFLWAVSAGRESFVSLIVIFFISLAIFLIILPLAREKLLR